MVLEAMRCHLRRQSWAFRCWARGCSTKLTVPGSEWVGQRKFCKIFCPQYSLCSHRKKSNLFTNWVHDVHLKSFPFNKRLFRSLVPQQQEPTTRDKSYLVTRNIQAHMSGLWWWCRMSAMLQGRPESINDVVCSFYWFNFISFAFVSMFSKNKS